MTFENEKLVWPPPKGKEFIRSDEFGALLVTLVCRLAANYPEMDFTDAAASVFAWFDKKLSRNRRFINRRRFPTFASFAAYLRQAVWNAARLTERERRRYEHIEAFFVEGHSIIDREIDPERMAEMHEAIDSLPEPHRTVFDRYFFDEEDLSAIANIYNLSEEQAQELYAEAVDMLALHLFR